MSNHPLRKETNCLNCGAAVSDRFCSHCGQENTEPRESFWQLLVHFFNDFTHFDGKFFSTIRVLLLKPGKLTNEYIAGKRASYLHPIRMYLFISFAYFILQYLVPSTEEIDQKIDERVVTRDSVVRLLDKKIIELNQSITDSIPEIIQLKTREKVLNLEMSRWKLKLDSSQLSSIYSTLTYSSVESNGTGYKLKIKSNGDTLSFSNVDTPISPALYEYYQQQLPVEKRDGKVVHFIMKKTAELREKYNGEEGRFMLDLEKKYSLYLPKLLFVSLPITAWILLLLYRRKKKWWYTEHAILTIHLYCGTFLILLLQLLTSTLLSALHVPLLKTIVENIWFFLVVLYNFFTLYRFYQQSVGKTLLKTFLFLFLQVIEMCFLIVVFLLISLATL
ncbi:MAG: DUF3667 domain-containing protein [Sediminibacterium sp.]